MIFHTHILQFISSWTYGCISSRAGFPVLPGERAATIKGVPKQSSKGSMVFTLHQSLCASSEPLDPKCIGKISQLEPAKTEINPAHSGTHLFHIEESRSRCCMMPWKPIKSRMANKVFRRTVAARHVDWWCVIKWMYDITTNHNIYYISYIIYYFFIYYILKITYWI